MVDPEDALGGLYKPELGLQIIKINFDGKFLPQETRLAGVTCQNRVQADEHSWLE